MAHQAVNRQIEGYASAVSINRGESITFFVSTDAPTYTLAIYRLGWYGGTGGRLMLGPLTKTGGRQAMPSPDPITGLVECNWTPSYILQVPDSPDPTDWASGVYVARLSTPDNIQSFIVFVVRDDARRSDHYFLSSVNTAEAYNPWGGKSLYKHLTSDGVQARKVSFNRPYTEGAGTGTFLWRWEYNMVRFLEREGFDVTYCTDLDLARRGQLLLNHKDLLIVGHPEYWSYEMRGNVESARDSGVHLGWFAGNGCYWQVRYEPSPISGAPDRTLVGYKEFASTEDPFALDSDPSNDKFITSSWRNPPLSRPEASLIGIQYIYGHESLNADIVIDDVTTVPWIFAGTGLRPGDRLPQLVGYEVDAMAPSSPPGTIRLAHSPFVNIKTTPNTTQYSDMTIYTAASGALVFATGTIQWSWGLDAWVNGATRVNAAAQQITRNVLTKFSGADSGCRYSVTAPLNLPASGGSGTIVVKTSPTCRWTASSSASWLTITTATSGTGDSEIGFTYAPNPSAMRTTVVNVADQSVVLAQSGMRTRVIRP